MEIDEKNLKNILEEQREDYQRHLDVSLKEQREEYQRYLGVVAEDFDSKFDLAMEGHEVLDKKIEDFRSEVGGRFDEVDYKFGIVFDELHVIRNELKEKVSRDEFVLLEKRVITLEKSKK